jgi:hypothetical protein
VSLDKNGTIYKWLPKSVQNFSAFAPSFKEIENNVLYIEQEDELDLGI